MGSGLAARRRPGMTGAEPNVRTTTPSSQQSPRRGVSPGGGGLDEGRTLLEPIAPSLEMRQGRRRVWEGEAAAHDRPATDVRQAEPIAGEPWMSRELAVQNLQFARKIGANVGAALCFRLLGIAEACQKDRIEGRERPVHSALHMAARGRIGRIEIGAG